MEVDNLNEIALKAVMDRINNEVYMTDMISPQMKIGRAMEKLVGYIKQNPSIINLKQKDDN